MASQAELPTEDRATAGTRGVLMEAAFALAGEIPLSDLTLRPLAERAGVSEARGKFVFLLITALDKGPLAAYLERRPNLEGYLVRSRPKPGRSPPVGQTSGSDRSCRSGRSKPAVGMAL